MGPRVVIDTNVLMSGLGWKGPSDEILWMIERKEFEFLISVDVLKEYLRVVHYPKFSFREEERQRLLLLIATRAKIATVSRSVRIVKKDPSDDKFLELAEAAQADYLITGDRHLLELEMHGMTKILTPSGFLKEKRKEV